MKSINTFFIACIGMIFATSCTAEMEQNQADQKEPIFNTQMASKAYEEDLAIKAVEDSINGNYDESTAKAKINCITTSHGEYGQTNAHACVNVDGMLFDVVYWGGYSDAFGNEYLGYGHATHVSKCRC